MMRIVDVVGELASREKTEGMMRRFLMYLILLWLVGCVGTSRVSVVLAPTVMPRQIVATPTALAERVQTRLVSNKSIHDYYWTPDGATLVFAQSEKCPAGCKTTWYRFDATTGITTTFESETVTIDPQLWKRLTDSENDPPQISPLKDPRISPSREWIVYSRESLDYTPQPCPKGPCFSPMELWLARVDGSESIKVSDLGRGIYCVALNWFEVEQKVLLSCGYEGPGRFVVADLKNQSIANLDDIVGEHIASLERAVLSPDGTRLAVNRMITRSVELQAIPLNGSPITNLGQGATAAQWLANGQRLYYLQRITPGQCAPAAIHAYDFATGQDKVALGPEIALSPPQHVTLDACEHTFLVSPTEDAVLLALGESGSWIVGWH